MDNKNFFEKIKLKLFQKVDRRSDQIFWSRFDEEFGTEKSSNKSRSGFIKFFIPVSALGLLIAFNAVKNSRELYRQESLTAFQVLEYSEVLENYDLFMEFEEEDWSVLDEET